MFPFTKKSYLHRAQWRYYFYLSRVRILVSPWLLTWLANYKRASRSGARPVLLKFRSQNGFEVRRRYSYRWLSRWAAKFSHRYFFRAWRTFRKICQSLGKFIEGEENVNTKKRPFRRAPRNQRNREDSSNWIRQLLEPVCFSKDQDWKRFWTVISPQNFG